MKRKINGEQGMSLVEVTIILMVLAILTAVAAPSIGDYVSEARQTKAKEDVEALGTGIIRLVRDTGGRCVRLSGLDGCTLVNRVGILRSEGPDIVAGDLGGAATTAYIAPTAADINGGSGNWDDDRSAGSDTFENQLVLNTPNYDTPNEGTPTGYTRGGPAAINIGWRGAYVASFDTDPWGKPYLANVMFLGVATNASDSSLEGARSGGWSRDTIVISAGANGKFDTPFGGSTNGGTNVGADDIVFVIQGDTR